MGAPFTVNSPTTGQVVYMVDGQGNSVQAGTITSGDGVALTQTASPATPSTGELKVFSPDGQSLQIVNSAGVVSDVATGDSSDDVTVAGNLTVDGTTTLQGLATVNNQIAINRTTDSSAINATYTVTANATNAAFAYNAEGSTGRFLSAEVAADTSARFVVDVNGAIAWGPGSAGRDTTLSRTGTGVLTASGLTVTAVTTLNGGTSTAGSAPVLTPTFANGTAAQLATLTRDFMVYLTVGTAGTAMVIKIGPTSTPANTIVSSSVATSGQMYAIRLPAGWFLQWADTTGTLANQIAIGC
jgi:hypothetical protein